MELSMSMFATQADYWKARAGLHEGTVAEVATELCCEADNEVLLAEIAALKKDAARYRWLRDKAVMFDPVTERDDAVWCVIGTNAQDCNPCDGEELDAAIDEARKTPNAK